MAKRIFTGLLAALLLLSLAVPAAAEETAQAEQVPAVDLKIQTVPQLLALAENCRLDSYSQDLVVSLEKDLDLTGTEFEGIPIFCGTFLGNNHTIQGLDIKKNGSAQGLFRYLAETAVVEKLTVQGEVEPEGSRSIVGGIAGENRGTIRNCSFIGTMSGKESVGGITGRNTLTGIIEYSRSSGEVYGSHFVGGIAGENDGVIRRCENAAKINTTAKQNSVSLSDISIDALTNTEAANTVTDIGGIAGSSSGVIRSSTNWGEVGYQHMGYNIGGIAGSQSGYVADCANHGDIRGRKEVGGIVGQLEPAARIEYEEDALEILERQLNDMGKTVNQVVANTQASVQELGGNIYALQEQVWNAKDAVEILKPKVEKDSKGKITDVDLPDKDAITAARNGISNSLSDMTSSLKGMGENVQSTMGTLSNDLHALKDHMDTLRTTLGNISETLGGSIADVSDEDTEEELSGKVEDCVNGGDILGDRNAGGIAGAMAVENDLDPEDDWQILGENSLNFESLLRAVIKDCENGGTVSVRKQNAGGIVGWHSMGLVKNCGNTGTLDAEAASYVGGVSGRSIGYIRQSYAKCRISGQEYVGGIAGSGWVVTDCRSMVLLQDTREKTGEILGMREDSRREEEMPVSGNCYVPVERDDGGIDGISYTGLAEPLEPEAFLALEGLPSEFRTVTVSFRYSDGMTRKLEVQPGGTLKQSSIPKLPEKAGMIAQWEGLAEADLSNITFDMAFEAVYHDYDGVIQSEMTGEDGRPVLLVQGTFTSDAAVMLADAESVPVLQSRQSLAECWQISLNEPEQVTAGRCLVPAGMDGETLTVMLSDAEGCWNKAEAVLEGSYLVFPMDGGTSALALVQEPESGNLWIAAVVIGAVAAGAAAVYWYWKKQKNGK